MLRKGRKHKLTALLIIVITLSFYEGLAFAEGINIEIISDNIIGKINPLVLGANIIAYDPSGSEDWKEAKTYTGYSNYGAGIWDPKWTKSKNEVINLAKNIRISVMRFPGSSPNYDWKNTIGSPDRRPRFLYGLDEFLKTAQEIGSEVIYTFPYFIGTADDAADLVEYLNAECDGKNPGGGIDWANERVKNGHPEPYRVKYFELGNEVNFGIPQKGVLGVDPAVYANKYLEYKKAMKAIDASVLLGAVSVNSENVRGISPWNNEVFGIAGREIDFLIEHTYRKTSFKKDDENIDITRLYKDTLASIPDVETYYRELSRHFESVTGRKNIPIAVTEYNIGFVEDKPVPFRHTLGAALFNAGLLQIFMKPENNILMANYWQFANSAWGMIKNNQFMQGKGHYVKRPNYYALEMLSRNFGTELIDVKITETSPVEKPALPEGNDLLLNISWTRHMVFGVNIDVEKNGSAMIDFIGDQDINFHHLHKRIPVKPDTTYILSGYLRAEGLKDLEGVCLSISDGRGWQYHADTTDKVWGNTDWIRVETEYTTLKDEKDLTVVLRRIGNRGYTVTGKVYARDIRMIEKPVYKFDDKESLMISASMDRNDNSFYVMVLNKNILKDVKANLIFNKRNLSRKVTAWTLNGPEIWSSNEVDPTTVKITEKSVEMNNDNQIDYVFPAHSLTSLHFTSMH